MDENHNNHKDTLIISENGNDSIEKTRSVDYIEDSFDKFLSSEESDLIKED